MISFVRTAPGVHDPATDTWTAPSVTTVTGSAIQVRGDPRRYAALGLVLTTMPTLFFAPTTYGQCPEPGDSVLWPLVNGKTYTVKDVDPIAPDGVVIAARIVVGV